MKEINASGLYYRELNKIIRELIAGGENELILHNVNGQRYLGNSLKKPVQITINGTPGNDMAAFASGVTIRVNGNVQDAIGNTMDDGKIIISGDAGDIIGYAMRGGNIHIKGDVGYRVGIHMKGYQDKQPTIIIGGKAGEFFGEYMAGGRMILLGLNCDKEEPIIGNHIGVGMHGGIIYIRGEIEDYRTGREVSISEVNSQEREELKNLLTEYCQTFGYNQEEIMQAKFSKLTPISSRPYGNLYAY